MLRVWAASGQELAIDTQEVSDVLSLKRLLRRSYHFPVCLQQLLHGVSCLDNMAQLEAPADLQLVLLRVSSAAQRRDSLCELVDYAALHGHVEVARFLVEAGTEVDSLDCTGIAALSCAASKGHAEMVRLLLAAGADKDLQDGCGMTALSHASLKGHVEVVCLLAQAGADTDLQDTAGMTALSLASMEGHTRIVEELLKAGADKDLQDHRFGTTALIHAAAQGHLLVAEALVRAGANKDLRNSSGITALAHAANAGRAEMARLLLEAGADKDLRAFSGATPLLLASSKGHVEIVRLLLGAGADMDVEDRLDGTTALHQAVAHGHVAVARLLVEAGAGVDVKDCMDGMAVLSRASSDGQVAMVRLLLEARAEVDSRDRHGCTALMKASQNGHAKVARLLLEAGAKDWQSQAMLGFAGFQGGPKRLPSAPLGCYWASLTHGIPPLFQGARILTATRYCIVVLATNSAATGRRDIATEFVWVTDVFPPKDLAYPDPPLYLVKDQPMAPMSPTVTTAECSSLKSVANTVPQYNASDCLVQNYDIQPPLPAGLSLDAKTGVISGTPTELLPRPEVFLVTATNGGGKSSAFISLAIIGNLLGASLSSCLHAPTTSELAFDCIVVLIAK
ncbi:ANKRD50 [Symbiodinium natans]|uniref:ANKRD50 protein n=1 Tax=Symbiodinium natans TaxID=878477 RepID=A0A812RLT8_9DINO|nr:ANKRD50 [Symbiodinium natans]